MQGFIVLGVMALVCALPLAANGQLSKRSFESRFGARLETYRYRDGLLLTVRRGAGNAVTEFLVEPAHTTSECRASIGSISLLEVSTIIDDLAPEEHRGAPGLYSGLTQCINTCTTRYTYSNVEIDYVWNAFGDRTGSWFLHFRWHEGAPFD